MAIIASLPLAYAIQNFDRSMFRPLLLCFGTTGVVGMGYFAFVYVSQVYLSPGGSAVPLGYFIAGIIVSLVEYVPVTFLLEEVSFRGAVDSHIYHPGDPHFAVTAVYTSVLWGLWHLPFTYQPGTSLVGTVQLIVELVAFQGVVGYFLSVFWRRSGNLLVPGSVHAAIDSVRNGLAL